MEGHYQGVGTVTPSDIHSNQTGHVPRQAIIVSDELRSVDGLIRILYEYVRYNEQKTCR